MSANACCCSSETCRVYGCQANRQGVQRPYQQLNLPNQVAPQQVFNPQFSVVAPAPIGCICPPTSERTCQRLNCGRKPYNEVKA